MFPPDADEEAATLTEVMFHAEKFCAQVERRINDSAPDPAEDVELRLKIGQCRNILALLQVDFENDQLNIESPVVRANFRYLVMAILWVAFRSRRIIDFKLFRMVMRIESTFSYLLIMRR